jgi:two-component system cell cycle sensor histidine kinase/response regulator CckA
MFERFREIFVTPTIDLSIGQTDKARLLNNVVIGIALGMGAYFFATTIVERQFTPNMVIPLLHLIVLYGLARYAKRSHVRTVSLILIFGLFVTLSISAYNFGGVRSPSFVGLSVIVLFAGLLLGFHVGLMYIGLYILTGMVLLVVELNGDLIATGFSISPASSLFAQVLHTVGGLLVLYSAVVHDVMNKPGLDNTLQLKKELCESLVDSNFDGIMVFDRECRFTIWNPGMERIFRVGGRDVLGKCAFEVFPFLKETGEESNFNDALAGRMVIVTDRPFVVPEAGREGYYDARYSPLRDQSGEVIGGVAVVRETTEWKRAEMGLLGSEEKFRAIAQAAADAIVLVDDEGRIIFWNKAAENIFGYREEEMLGKPFTILLPEASIGCHEERMMNWKIHGPAVVQDQVIKGRARRNGSKEFPIELSLSSWKMGKKKFICAIFRDVTEKQETQKRFVMQERLAAVGSLMAGIVHDFNNALSPIILCSEMLLSEGSICKTGIEALKVIRQQARHASSLTKQILDFSRQNRTIMQTLNLTHCLREFKKLFERTFPENINIKFDSGSEELFITGDANRLKQSLLNLAINARDAMPKGGEFSLRLSSLVLDPGEPPPFLGMQPGNWIRLDVTDTGEGILAENLPRIFEPFFTTKRDGEGHGLGLTQVYGIVKQHNGFIDVVSRPGRGTTFTIYLPALSECKVVEEEMDADILEKGDQETVLVVEDDRATRQALCETLEHMNYRALAAENSREAIEIYERENIDVVLCDLVMPEMGGWELHDALKERDPNVRMIIISGYPLEDCSKELIDRGISGLIQKPTEMKIVIQTVSQALIE